MKPVLLIGHDKDENFGVAPAALADAGMEVQEHRAGDGRSLPPLSEVGGIVLFGGEMNVDMTDRFPFLAEERSYVRKAVDTGVPYLGICLGAQMLARALDREVQPAGVREIGFNVLYPTPEAATDVLSSVFHDGDMVFHWHEDTFELPETAVLLATGDAVRLQAFRIGDRSWGMQFHFEVHRQELELWLRSAGEEEVQRWGKTSAQIVEEADRYLATQEQRAVEVFQRFADVVRSS
jgi:GMP synthase (glutamine-hydrolysing)